MGKNYPLALYLIPVTFFIFMFVSNNAAKTVIFPGSLDAEGSNWKLINGT